MNYHMIFPDFEIVGKIRELAGISTGFLLETVFSGF